MIDAYFRIRRCNVYLHSFMLGLFMHVIFAVVCGGLPASSRAGFTAYVSNSGGDLWWFAVMCGSFFSRWFVVVSGG